MFSYSEKYQDVPSNFAMTFDTTKKHERLLQEYTQVILENFESTISAMQSETGDTSITEYNLRQQFEEAKRLFEDAKSLLENAKSLLEDSRDLLSPEENHQYDFSVAERMLELFEAMERLKFTSFLGTGQNRTMHDVVRFVALSLSARLPPEICPKPTPFKKIDTSHILDGINSWEAVFGPGTMSCDLKKIFPDVLGDHSDVLAVDPDFEKIEPKWQMFRSLPLIEYPSVLEALRGIQGLLLEYHIPIHCWSETALTRLSTEHRQKVSTIWPFLRRRIAWRTFCRFLLLPLDVENFVYQSTVELLQMQSGIGEPLFKTMGRFYDSWREVPVWPYSDFIFRRLQREEKLEIEVFEELERIARSYKPPKKKAKKIKTRAR